MVSQPSCALDTSISEQPCRVETVLYMLDVPISKFIDGGVFVSLIHKGLPLQMQ